MSDHDYFDEQYLREIQTQTTRYEALQALDLDYAAMTDEERTIVSLLPFSGPNPRLAEQVQEIIDRYRRDQ